MTTIVHEYVHYYDFKELRGENDVWSITVYQTASGNLFDIFLPPQGLHTIQIGGAEKTDAVLQKMEHTEFKAYTIDRIFSFIAFLFLAIFLVKRWKIFKRIKDFIN